jgi:membrane-associated HD superfamily phosphohydrolase
MENLNIYLWAMNKTDQVKTIAYPIIVGIIGSLVLVGFFSSLMSFVTIEKLLPYIIGFNAALTGYNLIKKTDNSLKFKRIFAISSGVLMVITTAVILDLVMLHLMGSYLIYLTDAIFLIIIGGVSSGLGAILAIKYLNMNQFT